jgi:hypothetical protein
MSDSTDGFQKSNQDFYHLVCYQQEKIGALGRYSRHRFESGCFLFGLLAILQSRSNKKYIKNEARGNACTKP